MTLILRKEQSLRWREGEVLNRTQRKKRADGKHINEEFHDLHPVPNINRNKISNKKN
jgi:hypothetical protein